MKSMSELKNAIFSMDHRNYPAYKALRGEYRFDGYILRIEHVQPDPFAPPSRLSIVVSGAQAGIPEDLYETKHKRIALQDHLLRLFARAAEAYQFKAAGSGKSGLLSVSRCGQEVIERSACAVAAKGGEIVLRFAAGFPANGRTINAPELVKMLFEFLPQCAQQSLLYRNLDAKRLRDAVALSEDQHCIRQELPRLGLCAFVADGSILPRGSGVSQKPLRGAVPFVSPDSMAVTFTLPHAGTVRGMGFRRGVSVIVGGGFHGKSTLLQSLQMGVYNHIAGDGREFVIADDTAVKIRAEDGRSVKKADISLFIRELPGGRSAADFYTEDASGSTSQAANVVEAMEAGASLLLVDEDTCATNFMIRDELMQRVVHPSKEPIIPFIERVRCLYEQYGISSIIVAGSSGMFFHPADCVLQMDAYHPREITALAKEEAAKFPLLARGLEPAAAPSFLRCPRRNPARQKEKRLRVKALGKDAVQFCRETVELRYVEQLADSEQTAALAYLLRYAEGNALDGKRTVREAVDFLTRKIETEGLDSVEEGSYLAADLAMPRRQEIAACLNRYRGLVL